MDLVVGQLKLIRHMTGDKKSAKIGIKTKKWKKIGNKTLTLIYRQRM